MENIRRCQRILTSRGNGDVETRNRSQGEGDGAGDVGFMPAAHCDEESNSFV